MYISSLDIKTMARTRGAHQPGHPLLPAQVLAFTNYWLALNNGHVPAWSAFDMLKVSDAAPYLTVLRRCGAGVYEIEFAGSAVAAMAGEDLTGKRVNRIYPMQGEIDWFSRVLAAAEHSDVNFSSGTINAPHTPAIEYVGADFPFKGDGGDPDIVVCLTMAKLN